MKPCPYCDSPVKLMTSREVYQGRDFGGQVWACSQFPRCHAYVGCHPGTKKPLGRLANKELRAWKVMAHAEFDPMWKHKMEREQLSKSKARQAGYVWLAAQLGIEVKKCHIGWFDVEQCKRVVMICRGAKADGRKRGIRSRVLREGQETPPEREAEATEAACDSSSDEPLPRPTPSAPASSDGKTDVVAGSSSNLQVPDYQHVRFIRL